jgi:hypothetical protein
MGHGFHGELLVITRGYHWNNPPIETLESTKDIQRLGSQTDIEIVLRLKPPCLIGFQPCFGLRLKPPKKFD